MLRAFELTIIDVCFDAPLPYRGLLCNEGVGRKIWSFQQNLRRSSGRKVEVIKLGQPVKILYSKFEWHDVCKSSIKMHTHVQKFKGFFFFFFQIWRSCATFRDGQSSLLTKMMGASHIELPSLEPATAIRFCDMVRNCISYYWSINAWWMPNRNKVGADFFTFCNKTKQNISILGILKISVGILKITIWSAGPTFDTLNNNNNNTLVC